MNKIKKLGLSKYLIAIACVKEYWKSLIELCNISQCRIINTIVLYLALHTLFLITMSAIAIGSMLLIYCIELIQHKIDNLIFGKNHQKILNYNFFILWLIKLKVDITFAINWVKFNLLPNRSFIDYDKSPTQWARCLSLENMMVTIKNIIVFFFCATSIHVLLGEIALYTYYEDDIIRAIEWMIEVIMQSKITSNQLVEMSEMITILCLLGYIVFDIRHKANGYSDIRVKRFKKLILMEEKLLDILSEILYSLEKNIDVIATCKISILQNGASNLSGKQCHIYNAKIEFENRNRYFHPYIDDGRQHFFDLDDMKKTFQKLKKLNAEFKASTLSYSNINLVDPDEILTRNINIWAPEIVNIEYTKLKCFCKSSMEKWYKNWFVSPIERENGKKEYFSEKQTRDRILSASAILDFELERAFLFELYIKMNIKKLTKRFKTLNNLSKFNLN